MNGMFALEESWWPDNREKLKLPYNALSPTDEAEGCEKYEEALEWALNNSYKIKNIAISGPYGSGKSSVIETFIKKHHDKYSFLNISLATFENKQASSDTNSTDIDPPNPEGLSDDTDLQRLIELSIAQQLFYREDDSNIPYSRFKKISAKKRWQLGLFRGGLILFIAVGLFLFFPDRTAELLNLEVKNFSESINFLVMLFMTGFFVYGYQLIKLITNISIKKFAIQSTEFEIDESISKSILNSHIDEIIYFFEATNYNVVIIEDLDRFGNTEIFTKLREINLLINSSKKHNKNIVFVYAIKDDMFLDKDRAKFFDFMIPIIPVINFSNSGEKIREKTKGKYTISEELIDNLSLFIDDMRLLYNIINEFEIYSSKLGNQLEQDKLLAMIVYKNLFPKDFVDLSANKGNLYNIITQKYSFIEKERSRYDFEIEKLNTEIKNAKKEHNKDIKELRILYISKVIEKLPENFAGLCIENVKVSIDNFTTDENFDIIKKGSITYMKPVLNRISNYSYNIILEPTIFTVNFSEIENEVDLNRSYDDREVNLLNITIPELQIKIKNIKSEKEILQKKKLKDLVSEKNIIIDDKEKKYEIIYVLLKNGYIAEDYLDYISIFHEGSITKHDYGFLRNVKKEEKTDFDYELHKINELITKIEQDYFEKEHIFNYKLADVLIQPLSDKDEKKEKKKTLFLKQLANEKESTIYFIDSFLQRTEYKELFVQLLCSHWSNIWNYVQIKSSFNDEKKESYFIAIMQYANIEDIKKIFKASDEYISQYENFFLINREKEDLKKIVEELKVKFRAIDKQTLKEDLLYIYKNNHYALSCEMIKIILPNQNIPNDFFIRNYSYISSSKHNELNDYIENNINEYVKLTLLQLKSNNQENLEPYTILLNNKELDISLKALLIEKQNTVIDDISTIEDLSVQNLLLKYSKINKTWKNILILFEQKESILSEETLVFLNNIENAEELSKNKMPTDKDEDGVSVYGVLNRAIIHCNSLTDDVYTLLIKSSPWWYKEFDTEKLTIERINKLIDSNNVNPVLESYQYLKANFEGAHLLLVEAYFDEFNDKLSDLLFSTNDLEILIKSESLSNDQKYKCIDTVSDGAILESVDVCNYIINELLAYNIKDSLLKALLNSDSIDSDLRIRLFNKKTHLLSDAELDNFLTSLGEHYADITDKTKKTILNKTDVNELLLSTLKNIKYISSFTEKKDNLYVHHFRKK